MRVKKPTLFFVVTAVAVLGFTACSDDNSSSSNPPRSNETYLFNDPDRPIEERVDNIVSLMTFNEKISALATNPAVPRLGIRGSGHAEGLHGMALGGPGYWGGNNPVPTTQFPQSVGLGETWDPEIIRLVAAAEGTEARYVFQNPNYRRDGLVIRAPNADLARDPRWGRSEESFGEDPFLTGTLTTAFVRGLQGDDPNYWRTASLLKHFMANSNEDGRDGSSSDFDERLLREYYSVPFRMGIEQGGARAFMTAYNAVNGIPMTVHPTLKNMVMEEWGFDGIICTDSGALTNMVTQHHYYGSMPEAAAGAVKAGINQFLDTYQSAVRSAVSQGLLSGQEIDRELKGAYRVMIRLGLLDPPQRVPYAAIGTGPAPWMQDEHRQLARQVTQKSIVLLKNSDNLLPLDSGTLDSIAVIGPYANQVLLDWYSGTPPYTVSPLQGIQNRAGGAVTVSYAADNTAGAAAQAAADADIAIVVVGNHPTCDAGWAVCPLASDGKEAIDRQSITLEQETLVQAVFAANPQTVLVLRSSFPYAVNWSKANIPAIVHLANNSQEEGNALADVLFGDINPAGRLVTTWPGSIDHLPPIMDYNIRNGRTYMYSQNVPLYPFGYGLSYTTFGYSNLQTSAPDIPADGAINVSVDITNTGSRAGDEVVQMYIRYPNSAVTRPVRELKGFQRISLQAGETRQVIMPLAAQSLAYFNENTGSYVVEAEDVVIEIGRSSAEIELQQIISVAP
jgi:beta-glucosidase